jgi:hypothetical protein
MSRRQPTKPAVSGEGTQVGGTPYHAVPEHERQPRSYRITAARGGHTASVYDGDRLIDDAYFAPDPDPETGAVPDTQAQARQWVRSQYKLI